MQKLNERVGSTVESIVRRSHSRRKFSRSTLMLAAAGVAGIAGLTGFTHVAHANTVYSWNGPGGTITAPVTGNWNTAANWTQDVIPVSGNGTELDFGGSGTTAYTSTDNFSSAFVLNEIQLNSTATVGETIANSSTANPLTFNSSGSTLPSILQDNTGAFTISSVIALNNNLTIGGTGTGTLNLSGVISGSGGLVINATGTVALSGINTFTGNVIINSGTVTGAAVAGTNSAAPNSFGANGNSITVNAGATLAGVVGDARSVLGGNLTTRQLNINGGTYNANYSATGGEYFYNINMTGGSVITTSSTYLIRTSNGSTGATGSAANGGIITTLPASTTANFACGIDMTWASLTFNIAQGTVANGGPDFLISGLISQDTGAGSGAKSLTKNGAGILQISGPTSYTGPTTVNQGTLFVTGSLGGSTLSSQFNTGATQVSVLGGATLETGGTAPTIGLSGTGTTGVSIAGGATFSTADGIAQTTTLYGTSGTTTLALGDSSGTAAILEMDHGDLISTPGMVVVGGSGAQVSLSGAPIGGTYTLVNASGGISNAGNFTLPSSSINGYSLSLNYTNNLLTLTESAAPPVAYWNGTTNSSWNYFNSSNSTTNWVNASGSELGQTPGGVSDVFFTTASVGPGGLNTALNNSFTINSLTFTGTGTSATSPVTIAGPGTLTILAGAGATYPAGTGIVISAGSGAHTISANVAIGGAQSWTDASTNPLTVSGNIGSTSTYPLVLTGSFNFTGANTYTGTTNFSGGTLNYTGAAGSSGGGLLLVANTSNAVVNMNTTGTLAFGATGSAVTSSAIGSVASGAVNQLAGIVNFTGSSAYLFMGTAAGSYGSYTLAGGTLNLNSSSGAVVGYDGTGSLLMTGGAMTLSRTLYLGDGSNAASAGQGIATFMAGNISSSNTALYGIEFGSAGGFGTGGTFNLGTFAGGTATFTATYSGAAFYATNENSYLNLNHGTLALDGTLHTQTSSGVSVNFNGGLLQAIATTTLIDSSFGAGTLNVYNGGANIGVASPYSAMIASALTSPSGNGIYSQSPSGVFTAGSGGSGYIGAPLVTVTDSTNSAAFGATAIANVSNGVVTGVTLTNPGQNYTVGDVLKFTFSGGGAATSAGTYSYALTAADIAANNLGGLTKSNTGTLILTAANSYAGPTTISGGTLQIGAGTTGSIPNTAVTIASGATLAFGHTDTAFTFPNSVSGAGSISQVGTGSTLLTGNLSYTGTTNVSAGRLGVNSSLPNTAISVLGTSSNSASLNLQASSGTFNIGSTSASLLVGAYGGLDLTDNTVGTYKLNGTAGATALTLGSASGTAAKLTFEIGATAGSSDLLAVTGNVATTGVGASIVIAPLSTDTALAAGNYTLITAGSGLTSSSIVVSSPLYTFDGVNYDLSLSNSTATSLVLNIKQDASTVATAYWSGAHNNVWSYTSSANSSPGSTNWQTSAGVDTGYIPGTTTNVIFTSSSSAGNLNTTMGAAFSINSLSFNGLASGPVGIGGTYPLTILAGSFNGNTAGNGINISSGSSAVTISAPVVLGTSQTWTDNSINGLVVSGNISGGASLAQVGTGPLTLSGNNSFTGGFNTSGGSLNLNSATAIGTGPFGIAAALTLDNTSGNPVTLTTNNAVALGGNLTFNGSSNLNLGSGLVTLNGNRSIIVTAGTLGIGGVTDNFSYYNFNVSGSGTLNVGGAVAGNTTLNLSGPGAVTFAGANTYGGATNVIGGTATYVGTASSSGLGLWTVAGASGATVNFNSSGSFSIQTGASSTFTYVVGGASNTSGSVVQNNGTITLNPEGSGSYVFVGASNGSYGSYVINGGTLGYVAGQSAGIVIGYDGVGSFLMTGGTFNMSRVFYVGDGSVLGSVGTGSATLTGGTVNVIAIANANAAIQIGSSNGYGAGGQFNMGTLAGGNAVYSSSVVGNTIGGVHLQQEHSNLNANLDLNHGTLSLAAGIIENSPNGLFTSAQVNLNGGILQATGSFPLLDASLSGSGYNACLVYNGGAILDVTGANVATVPANLIGATGNGIYGESTSGSFNIASGSGGSGYIGAPVVTVTGGSGNGALAIATVSGGAITSVTLTDPGQNYQLGDQISFSFTGGGTSNPAGTFNYTLTTGDIEANNGGLTKTNTGTLILSGSNTYTGPTAVNNGVLQVTTSNSLPPGTNLIIGSANTSASVVALSTVGNPLTVVTLGSLTLSGTTNAWTGKLDLTNGVAIIHNGSISQITNQIKEGYSSGSWQGSGGITSSTAAADTSHLTAIGVIINDTGANNGPSGGNAIYGSVDNASTNDGDILIKYTYYGDADLSGVVDGSDYSLIDNGYLNHFTGWYNGDFNYDGVVNGSDYTLIDNAFNMQGASLASQIANPLAVSTAQIAGAGTSAVPEPASLGLLGMTATILLGRRRRNRWPSV